jgi:predicted transglutaminase-like cysteine proteinase
MGKAEIIADLGAGLYKIKRMYAGREAAQDKIVLINTNIAKLFSKFLIMPESTEDEIFAKHIVKLQITSLEMQVQYIKKNFPEDIEVDVYCADSTEEISGEVGTIDIPGEVTAQVNIRPGYRNVDATKTKIADLETEVIALKRDIKNYEAQYRIMPAKTLDEIRARAEMAEAIAYFKKELAYMEAEIKFLKTGDNYFPERDGEFWPSIAVGPWTCFLNKCILPGWQKWYPKYRYGWIVPESIDYDDNTCAVTIQPAFSSQQGLDVNEGDGFGAEIVEEEREIAYFKQSSAPVDMSGFQDFCDRNPEHPICTNDEIGTPIELSDGQYNELRLLNYDINKSFKYESDQSGYDVGDYWDIMYDPETDTGDCEDFALTKAHAIIEAGIMPAKNMQIIGVTVQSFFSFGGKRSITGHAILGIQTLNHGFLMLDNRFSSLMTYDSLKRTYSFGSFQVAGTVWATVQRLKGDVPIEYMGCNAEAFASGDDVVVEFTGLDWDRPKVIGFKSNPSHCASCYFFPAYSSPVFVEDDKLMFRYSGVQDSWSMHGNFPEQPTQFAACTGYGGIGLRLGGYVTVWTTHYDWHVDPNDHHWMYDSVTETWEAAANSGFVAYSQQYKYIGGGVSVVMGGQYGKDGPIARSPATKGYSLSSDSWYSLQPERRRSAHASFVIDGKMFVAGGHVGDHEASNNFGTYWFEDSTDMVSAYNGLLDTWDLKKKLPCEFGRARGFSINGQGYIGGGSDMKRYKTPGELPDSLEVRAEFCTSNIFAYYLCPDTYEYYRNNPRFNWWISSAGMRVTIGRGYCEDDTIWNAMYQYSEPFEVLYDHGPPERYVTQRSTVGDSEGFITTGVGLYYDALSDTWIRGQCHPSYEHAFGDWANSELAGGAKAMRLGDSLFGPSKYSILNGITDTWTQHDSQWGPPGNAEGLPYYKNFIGGSIGSEL